MGGRSLRRSGISQYDAAMWRNVRLKRLPKALFAPRSSIAGKPHRDKLECCKQAWLMMKADKEG